MIFRFPLSPFPTMAAQPPLLRGTTCFDFRVDLWRLCPRIGYVPFASFGMVFLF